MQQSSVSVRVWLACVTETAVDTNMSECNVAQALFSEYPDVNRAWYSRYMRGNECERGVVPPLISPVSDIQIATLWRVPELQCRLMQIVSSRQLYGCVQAQTGLKETVTRLVDSGSGDNVIYRQIRIFYQSVQKGLDWANKRPDSRSKQILSTLPRGWTDTLSSQSRVLDVGCSEGSITAALGRALGLQQGQILGCDITELSDSQTEGFTFAHMLDPNVLPYRSGSVQLVTALMSLHHMRNVYAILLEMYRVLAPGGLLLIREHDLGLEPESAYDLGLGLQHESTKAQEGQALVIDVVHGLYSMVWSDTAEGGVETEDFTNYFARYRTRASWSRLIQGYGFSELRYAANRATRRLSDNPMAYYYTVYRKV